VIYLASPYSHPDPVVRQQRFAAAGRAPAAMLKAGLVVLSPIVHSHPLAAWGLDAMDHAFWMHVDRPMLEACTSVAVLTLSGWATSKGVAAEIDIARRCGKPISYVSPRAVGIADQSMNKEVLLT
jgi:hypothetical protein